MIDGKFDFTRYQNIGGINEKTSDHTTGVAQFLNLINLDCYTPNALSQIPGSTQAISSATHVITTGLHEFVRSDGLSQILVATEKHLFTRFGSSLVTTNYNFDSETQIKSFVTFLNNAWFTDSEETIPGGVPPRWDGSTYYITPTNFPRLSGFSVSINAAGDSSGNFGSLVGNENFRVSYAFSYQVNTGNTLAAFQGLNSFALTGLPSLASSSKVGASSIDLVLPGDGLNVLGRQGVSSLMIWRSIVAITGSNAITAIQKFESTVFYFLDKVSIGATFYRDTLGATNITFGKQVDWFGSNAASLDGTKFLEVFNNSLVYTGFDIDGDFVASDPDIRSQIAVSEVGDPTRVETDFVYNIQSNDGDRITGVRAFSNELVVFKERSFHRFIGTSHDNYQPQFISNEYGAINHWSITKGPDGLYFLDKQGVVKYDGANYGLISQPMESTFQKMNIDVAKSRAVAVNNLDRKQLWFSFPINGATMNNLTVVYDYVAKTWSKRHGPQPSVYGFMKADLSKPNMWYGGYTGLIYYNGTSFYGNNGEAMTCLAFTRFEPGSGFNHTDLWRRFFLDIQEVSGNTTPITVSFFRDYNQTTSVTARSFSHATFQQRQDFGIPSKSIAAQIVSSSASFPLQIKSFSWAFRKLRET